MNLGRIWTVASNVFLEVIRDRILYLVALFAVLMMAAAVLLPDISAGAQNKITLDLGLGAIHLISVVVAVFVGTGLVNKEIDRRTVLVLLSKPVSRWEIILGKHVGLSAVLAVLVALLTAVLLGVLLLNGIPFPWGSLLIAAGFMFVEAMLITAFAILFGVFTSSLLAILLTFAVYLMGHLSQDIVALGKLSETEGIQRITNSLYLVLPDLERFNLRNEAIYGMQLIPSTWELSTHLLYGLLYIGLLLVISLVIFSRRQF